MYKIGDFVFHQHSGVCEVEDIREEQFPSGVKQCYIMHPLGTKADAKVMVPVNSHNGMVRSVYTPEEIDDIIAESAEVEVPWIEKNNVRKATFSDIIHKGETVEVLALIYRMRQQEEVLVASGKKLTATDERLLSEATKKIDQGFAFSLKIEEGEVLPYVLEKLNKA
ncbi:MAG: CarD family transcriptional regulator [Lachnospiraceae bacterium]|nr:CarD family transcriptional regulator [Lachnospiraceae bacterium]